MADPFLAEIRMFGCNFAPQGWAQCDGQILAITQNTALFSLLGTTYGGNGTSNFALPNLQGCAPMHPGQGPGLTPRDLGEIGGSDTVTLLESEMPSHSHPMLAVNNLPQDKTPSPADGLARSSGGALYQSSNAGLVTLDPGTIAPGGGGGPHNNLMPYLSLNFCIALVGIFPARS